MRTALLLLDYLGNCCGRSCMAATIGMRSRWAMHGIDGIPSRLFLQAIDRVHEYSDVGVGSGA
jgi:hypothetical protein